MRTVSHEALADFTRAIFIAAGSEPREADMVTDHLIDANLLGHDSHGVIRVPIYCEWVRTGRVLPNRRIETVVEQGPLLVLDGGFGYGQVIGRDAMVLAADRAAATGLALVAIRNSGHLGRIGAFAEQLARAGLVSLHFVNSSGGGIMVAPHGGAERRLSANPIAAGAPGPDGTAFVLDLATAIIAEGSLMLAIDRGEQIAPGLILDGAGKPSTNPADFYGPPRGAILPFGGHKGSGLSFFCEILAGSLTGGFSGHPNSPTADRLVNNMLSIVIAPKALGSEQAFGADVAQLAEWIRSARPLDEEKPVLLPGENGERTRARRLKEGIPLDDSISAKLRDTALKLQVEVPSFLE